MLLEPPGGLSCSSTGEKATQQNSLAYQPTATRTMKKYLLWVVIPLIAIAATAAGSYWLYWFKFREPLILTTTSPASTYTVVLNGRADRPGLFGLEHTVRFRVLKSGQQVVSDQTLHSGDWFDPSYSILYPQHAWQSENVLHFYRKEYFDGGQPSTIVVGNKSNQTIKYLMVNSINAYLLFDLQPGSVTTLRIPPTRGDLTYLRVEGVYADGREVNVTGSDFITMGRAQIEYLITVLDTTSTIESPHVEKYEPSR